MPQLNPAPWFFILVYAWMMFLIILPTKVMSHEYPNEPTPQSAKALQTKPWDWPWL
nr:ATP synthase F0 subunit 8 [Symphysanodon typus]